MTTDDLFSVEGKTALVTGGSRGVGLMIARGLVEAGAKVYISSRTVEACELAAKELSATGTCVSLPTDLSTHAGCMELCSEIAEREPMLDILVNNAGAIWSEPLAGFPPSAWDKVLNVNLKAPFFLVQGLLPMLVAGASESHPARIVNIGSVYGLQASVHDTYSYAASKAALHHLTRVLAAELGPSHVTVNAIAPGPFETRMYAPEEAKGEHAPLERIGCKDDIVGAVRYLTSRAGSYITGTVLPVDGGRATTL